MSVGGVQNGLLYVDFDRLERLGIVAWCIEGGGATHANPGSDGLHAWAMIPEVRRSVEIVAGQDHDVQGHRIGEIAGGVPAVSVNHGRLVLAALPVGFDGSEAFAGQCERASLRVDELSEEIGAWAVHGEDDGDRLLISTAWGLDGYRMVGEAQSALAGYTRELTTCYETLEFVYRQGRAMEHVHEPERVLRDLCADLCEPLAITWASVWVLPGTGLPASLSDRLFSSGDPGIGESALRELCGALLRQHNIGRRTRLVPAAGLARHVGEEVIARGVRVGQGPGAVIVAGSTAGERLSSYEVQLAEASAGLVRGFLEVQRLWYAEQSYVTHMLESLTRAIDAKDPYTSGHSERVAHLSRALAAAAGLGEEVAERAYVAGQVHDIGKIGVPEVVLCKAGRLTDEEFEAIKKHPEIGARILERLTMLDDIRPAVLSHHERWDGRGYPHGLAGEGIDRLARVVCIADTFDAMSSNRAYRSAMSRQKVLEEIRACAGTQFDPVLAEAFRRVDLAHYDRMLASHAAQRVVKAA